MGGVEGARGMGMGCKVGSIFFFWILSEGPPGAPAVHQDFNIVLICQGD